MAFELFLAGFLKDNKMLLRILKKFQPVLSGNRWSFEKYKCLLNGNFWKLVFKHISWDFTIGGKRKKYELFFTFFFISSLFFSYIIFLFPFKLCIKMFMCYLNEGVRIYYRISLALMEHLKVFLFSSLGKKNSISDIFF